MTDLAATARDRIGMNLEAYAHVYRRCLETAQKELGLAEGSRVEDMAKLLFTRYWDDQITLRESTERNSAQNQLTDLLQNGIMNRRM